MCVSWQLGAPAPSTQIWAARMHCSTDEQGTIPLSRQTRQRLKRPWTRRTGKQCPLLSCVGCEDSSHTIFVTPQHILTKKVKKRMIYTAAFQHTHDSVSVNVMTGEASFTELHCKLRQVKSWLYRRAYNLCITHSKCDIVLHENDVKSWFCQLNYCLDCMGMFSFIIGDPLYLYCGLTYGLDFSPASWEVTRRTIEILAELLFEDDTALKAHKVHGSYAISTHPLQHQYNVHSRNPQWW